MALVYTQANQEAAFGQSELSGGNCHSKENITQTLPRPLLPACLFTVMFLGEVSGYNFPMGKCLERNVQRNVQKNARTPQITYEKVFAY